MQLAPTSLWATWKALSANLASGPAATYSATDCALPPRHRLNALSLYSLYSFRSATCVTLASAPNLLMRP